MGHSRSPLDALQLAEVPRPREPEPPKQTEPAGESLTALLLRDASAILAPLSMAANALLGVDAASAHAIHDGVARLGVIVRRLGALDGPPRPHAVHLNFVVASAVGLFRSLSQGARVVTRLEEPLPVVWVEPLALERALLGLLLDHPAAGGAPILLTTITSRDSARVLLHVHDAAHARPQIEPLRAAVAGAGGEVWLESSDDGARVTVALLASRPPRPTVATNEASARGDHDVAQVLVFPPFRLDVTNETIWRGDTKLHLRAKPFTILRYLAEHPQRLVTNEELTERVLGRVVRSDSLLRTHVRELRQVLGRGIIETVTGRGYRFAVEVTRVAEPSPAPGGPSLRPFG